MIALIIKSRQQLIFGVGEFESLFIVGEVRILNLLYNKKNLYQLSYNWNPRYSRRLKSPFVLFLKQLNSNLYEQQSETKIIRKEKRLEKYCTSKRTKMLYITNIVCFTLLATTKTIHITKFQAINC